MKRNNKKTESTQQWEGGRPSACDAGGAWDELSPLRSASGRIDEATSRIPPLSPDRLHALVGGDRLSQFQQRRLADRYLLALCLSLLALAASVLWHTASAGVTPLNVAVLIVMVAVLWVALRAARSLWLMWLTRRLCHRPYRMALYTDRLSRLSHRRRWWIAFVLRGSRGATSEAGIPRLRIPSYSIAACLFLIIALDADKAFTPAEPVNKVTTTSGKTDVVICSTVKQIIEQI